MDILIEELRKVGFTELEAKCLVVLAKSGKQTGYEVAKRLGVSRSNVYGCLQSLVEHGVVLVSKGDPNHYSAIAFEEIREKIERKVKQSFDALEIAFPSHLGTVDDFFTVEGDSIMKDHVQSKILRATNEVIADIWAEEADLFGSFLLSAESKGVRVFVSALGEVKLPLSNLFIDEREESWQVHGLRKFSFVIDRTVAILGVRGPHLTAKAVITEHPALVQLLLNNFFQDVVLHEIKRDMKDELEQRYGRNFEGIYRKYTGTGWDEESAPASAQDGGSDK